jgi:deoxyadenosine/deoxycytidine kinase
MTNFIISIEGNIGSGKSTLMTHLKQRNNPNIVFVDEPVNEWTTIKDSNGKNALDLFYNNQKDNSFWFQILAYITRLRNLLSILESNKNKLIICERSIYTDHYVFASMLYDKGYLKEMEWKTYLYWFDTFKKQTMLDLVLYVNTSPEECLNRINKRNRPEEKNKIPLEYLIGCHDKHTKWLNNSSLMDSTIVEINGNNELSNIYNQVDKIIYNLLSSRTETTITP